MTESSPTTDPYRSTDKRLLRWGRRLLSRDIIIATLVEIALISVLFFMGLRSLEWHVTFHPYRYTENDQTQMPRGATEVWLTTADNVRLNGLFFRSSAPSFATIIYFHGNSGNIYGLDWIGERLSRRGFDVLLIDYRGYGRSEGTSTGEQSVYADADAAYDYVVHKLGVEPERVVLYGQSLGTTAAADLASRNRCGALILESGLSSASDMAASILPWLPRPLHLLCKNRFDSARKLASVRCPVLVTHGEPDPVVPTEQGRKLFAAARAPKKLVIVPGVGHNVFESKGADYPNMITAFIRKSIHAEAASVTGTH